MEGDTGVTMGMRRTPNALGSWAVRLWRREVVQDGESTKPKAISVRPSKTAEGHDGYVCGTGDTNVRAIAQCAVREP